MKKECQAAFSLLGKGAPVRSTASQSLLKPSLKLECSNFKLLQPVKILVLSQVIICALIKLMDSEGKPQKTTILAIFMAWYFFRNQLMVIKREQQQHYAYFYRVIALFRSSPNLRLMAALLFRKMNISVLFHLSDWEGNHLVLTAIRTESLTY